MSNRKYIRRNKVRKPKTQVRKYKGNPNHVRVGRTQLKYFELPDGSRIDLPNTLNKKQSTSRGGDKYESEYFDLFCPDSSPDGVAYDVTEYPQANVCYSNGSWNVNFYVIGSVPGINNDINIYIGDETSTNPLYSSPNGKWCWDQPEGSLPPDGNDNGLPGPNDDFDCSNLTVSVHGFGGDYLYPSHNLYGDNNPTGNGDVVILLYNELVIGFEYINNISATHSAEIPCTQDSDCPYPNDFFPNSFQVCCPDYDLFPGHLDICDTKPANHCSNAYMQVPGVMLGHAIRWAGSDIPGHPYVGDKPTDLLLYRASTQTYHKLTDESYDDFFISGNWITYSSENDESEPGIPAVGINKVHLYLNDLIFNPEPYQGEPNFTLSLHSGNNLISFPIGLDDYNGGDINSVFEDERITDIIGEGVASTRVNGTWQGSIDVIEPTSSYWVNASEDLTVEYRGDALSLHTIYDIHSGNNYVSFPHMVCMSDINTIINPLYHGVITDIISEGLAARYVFGETQEDDRYEGSLNELCPGDGVIITSSQNFIGSIWNAY